MWGPPAIALTQALLRAGPLPALILCVLGGIFLGVMTPTEAGAIGAAFATLITILHGKFSINLMRRAVRDAAMGTCTIFIIATGESGHPLSRHYDDLGVLWRRGEYVPMSLDADLARAAAVGITRLTPR